MYAHVFRYSCQCILDNWTTAKKCEKYEYISAGYIYIYSAIAYTNVSKISLYFDFRLFIQYIRLVRYKVCVGSVCVAHNKIVNRRNSMWLFWDIFNEIGACRFIWWFSIKICKGKKCIEIWFERSVWLPVKQLLQTILHDFSFVLLFLLFFKFKRKNRDIDFGGNRIARNCSTFRVIEQLLRQ